MADTENSDHLRDLVATVAAAYFSNVHVAQSDIPGVVSTIAASLQAVGNAVAAAPDEAVPKPETPKATAAQVRKSITPDALISFEDGKSYKTLKRHLATRGITPAEYRAKWGLPADYPMVSPSYSAARSQLAKAAGLGRKAGEPARAKSRGRKS